MRRMLMLATILAVGGSGGTQAAGEGAFAFTLPSLEGGPMPLQQYASRALLVVNTASFCGYTYQYAALQRIQDTYGPRGLVVIGVPSGDFGGQEYASNGQIKEFCETRFDIDFPMSEKVHVRGPQADPLFAWFRAQLGEQAVPRWNFTKYLVRPDGQVVASWPSGVEPDAPEVTRAIEQVLPSS